MKIGSGDQQLEGTVQDISNLLENHGMDLQQFFRPAEEPVHVGWVLGAALLLLVAACALVVLEPPHQKIAFVVGLFALGVLVVLIQLRFKNGIATTVAAFGGILLLLAAHGVLSPSQVLDEAKAIKQMK